MKVARNRRVRRLRAVARTLMATGAFLICATPAGAIPVVSGLQGGSGVAVDAAGNIYVSEYDASGAQRWGRVRVFSDDGTPIRTIGSPISAGGNLRDPSGVAVDSSGNIFVSDSGQRRVAKFAQDGSLTATFSDGFGTGCQTMLFENPVGLAINGSEARILTGTNCVQVLNLNGSFLRKWGSSGSGPGQFTGARAIASGPNGEVLTLESNSRRVQKFDASGTFLTEWTGTTRPLSARGIAVSANGRVYVAATSVTANDPCGLFIERWTLSGMKVGDMCIEPTGGGASVAVDPNGDLLALDGVNIFRIPTAPVARIASSTSAPSVNQAVRLDGSASTVAFSSIANYEWDLDGNGTYETSTGGDPNATFTPESSGDKTVRLRVTSADGERAETETTLKVRSVGQSPTREIGVSINSGARFTDTPNVVVNLVWPESATSVKLSNDGGFGAFEEKALASSVSWKLDSSGPERLPKTVYVRFSGTSSVSQTFQDDIILDETPPVVRSASLRMLGARTGRPRARSFRAKVKARDLTSGVATVQAATTKAKPLPSRKYAGAFTIKAPKAPRWVRVKDSAGNWSRWKRFR